MFRTLRRKFLPNPLDWKLKKAQKKGCQTVLLSWNRGLGDIALGVAAIVQRIYQYLPNAKITVVTRENLKEGFSMLSNIQTIAVADWKRKEPHDLKKTNLNLKEFDLILDQPSPTDWCRWQYKTFTPKLQWDERNDDLYKKFDLSNEFLYVGIQVSAETDYGHWRNPPISFYEQLFEKLGKRGNVRAILFGFQATPLFHHPMVIDLRGKTSLFELISIVKNRCFALIAPDSGILSMIYYLNVSFPIRVISLWAETGHGILKQGVSSPNVELVHIPLFGDKRDLSTLSIDLVEKSLSCKKNWVALETCPLESEIVPLKSKTVGCVIMAGGSGSRLGVKGPKGCFSVVNQTLFQHLIEKIDTSVPIAIMTAPSNHLETVDYFAKHQNFHRKIEFFEQDEIDLLDEQYRAVSKGPDGNGGIYKKLVQSGLIDRFEKEGIDTLIISPIENILADPLDEKLSTYHFQKNADVTIKCILRNRGESMGMLCVKEGKIGIAEYFETDERDGVYSYMGQVAVSTKFVRKAAKIDLPYHWVKKKLKEKECFVWKREKLLFDPFFAAEKVQALCYPRESCYLPIKGPENLAEIEKRLAKR